MEIITNQDLYANDNGLLVVCSDWEKTGSDILKNQEDAEKWREIEPRIVKPKWVKSTVNENKEIVERLKQLILDMDTHGDVAKIWVKEVLLKKVLGEKNG